jgi:hypothetical protein
VADLAEDSADKLEAEVETVHPYHQHKEQTAAQEQALTEMDPVEVAEAL